MADLYTNIVKASVFRRGAELVRRGSAQLEEGAQTVYVYGLSPSTSTDTARLFSQEGVLCSDLRFKPQYDDETEDPKAKALREKIEELEKQIEVKELQADLWKSNGDFSARTSQPVSEVQDYIEKLSGRLEALNKEILKGRRELEELNKQLEKLSEQSAAPVMEAEVVALAAQYKCVLVLEETRGGIGVHLAIGITLAFGFIVFMKISTVYAVFGTLNPFVAVLLPQVSFGLFALYVIRTAPK